MFPVHVHGIGDLVVKNERKGQRHEICFSVQNRNDIALTISHRTQEFSLTVSKKSSMNIFIQIHKVWLAYEDVYKRKFHIGHIGYMS